MSSSPTFLDRFLLSLALELVKDVQQIQDWLRTATDHLHYHHPMRVIDDTTSSLNPTLYWRSTVQSKKQQHRPSSAQDQQLYFIDLTFTVEMDAPITTTSITSTPHLQVYFGYLYSRNCTTDYKQKDFSRSDFGTTDSNQGQSSSSSSSSSTIYGRWKQPFSLEDLKNLTQSVDLVWDEQQMDDEANLQALSATFCRALESKLRFDDNPHSTNTKNNNDNTPSLLCYYSELDQWGRLDCRHGLSESILDTNCTQLLFQNLRHFGDKVSDTKRMITDLDRMTVGQTLQRYFQSQVWNSSSSPLGEKVRTDNVPKGSSGVINIPPPTSSKPVAVSSSSAAAANKATTGFRQLPKKRRRGTSELKLKAGGTTSNS